MIPLIPAAIKALSDIQGAAQRYTVSAEQVGLPRIFAISNDGGVSHVSASSFSKWAKAAGSDINGFKAKRIRSGVETILASLKISSDTRGHLLSHGVTGVQAASYDGHDYMDVKREALERLSGFLEGNT